MERDAAPAVGGSSPPAPGGEGSPSGPHYEGSAFNGWTGARRAGRKSRARGVGNHTALPPEARSRQPKIAALERRKAQRPPRTGTRRVSRKGARPLWRRSALHPLTLLVR